LEVGFVVFGLWFGATVLCKWVSGLENRCMRIVLMIIACCSLFISCRKGNCANELVGSWKLVETSHIGSPWEAVLPAQQITLVLNSDNTYSINPALFSSSSSGCQGTYRIESGNFLHINLFCIPDPNYKDEVVYTLDGNTLIFNHILTGSGVHTRYVRQ
jgi:hypothetical protein